jgi:molybdopterin synthase sulfur carrier subunit
MITINIQVFAVLKDYFENEFSISVSENSIRGLKVALETKNPEAKKIIPSCRFAFNEQLISDDYKLNNNDKIIVLPPSSGG